MLDWILKQKALLTLLLTAVFIGGVVSYEQMGKLEDAEIPIKAAIVITPYPGATAHEVELEVTDVLERGIQRLENVDHIESTSKPGLSVIEIAIKEDIKSEQLPQLWDHLRRKVKDVEYQLPQGAYTPIVNDDFADTYGMLYAVTSDGFSKQELLEYTRFLEQELLAVKGVKRSQLFGASQQTVEVILTPEKLATMKLNPMLIAAALQNQGAIVNAGQVKVGDAKLRMDLGSRYQNLDDIRNLLIQIPGGSSFKLETIAEVRYAYMEPQSEQLYYDGKQAIALGLSNESGVNVVKLGEVLDAKMATLQHRLPAGISVEKIYWQPEQVDDAVADFVWNLIVSVAIVIIVLLFAMGWRSGLLISSGLVFTILGTLIVMYAIDLPLHRITLAAIILAMGMLVDNSIVVADGILMDLKKGVKPQLAFVRTVKATAIPLLAATLVAILAFLPLGMAPHSAGEFLGSLFSVLIISLLLSWVFAMIQTPFMAKFFYRKEGKRNNKNGDVYDNALYRMFKKLIAFTLKNKRAVTAVYVALLALSIVGFGAVKITFMPKIPYDQFVVEYKLPEGSDPRAVAEDLVEMQSEIAKMEGVKHITASTGRPVSRYTLMRPMSNGGENYGELIVRTESADQVQDLIPQIEKYLNANFPQGRARALEYGAAFADNDVEILVSGPDPAVLRDLSQQMQTKLRQTPAATNIGDNWSNKSQVLSPQYDVEKAQQLGINRSDVAHALQVATNGMPIGAIYEGRNMLPILLKSSVALDDNFNQLESLPVWGQQSMQSFPLSQLTSDVAMNWEDQVVMRYNGVRTIAVQCDAANGYTGEQLQAAIQGPIEDIKLPEGYSLQWKGMVGVSNDANGALFQYLPLSIGLMILIIVGLFNNLRQPAIIFGIVPFAIVGIAVGFLITGKYLTFVGIIGALGLIGMMIKNAVVLLDEIKLGILSGKNKADATLDAAVSRLSPVMMASLTTILGMVPLLTDPMFDSLAITIMFGLLFGAMITLILVPALYALFYKVDAAELGKSEAKQVELETTVTEEA